MKNCKKLVRSKLKNELAELIKPEEITKEQKERLKNKDPASHNLDSPDRPKFITITSTDIERLHNIKIREEILGNHTVADEHMFSHDEMLHMGVLKDDTKSESTQLVIEKSSDEEK